MRAGSERRILLASLVCPQPNDALQWRIFPLVRQALAFEAGRGDSPQETALGAGELVRFVQGNLPAACLAGISSTRLRLLVALVLERNVRSGRLLQRGSKYMLQAKEAVSVRLPDLPGRSLEAVWVAWCVETKRPREAALRYGPCSGPGPAVWLCARPEAGAAQRAAGGSSGVPAGPAEVVAVGGTEVLVTTGGDGAVRADWRSSASRTAWAFLVGSSGLTADAALEVVLRCIEQGLA